MSDDAAKTAEKRGRPRKEDTPERIRDRERKKAKKREVPPAGETPAPPPKPRVSQELKGIAGEYMVLLLWGMSWIALLPFGGKLPMLTKEELKEGSERALPLMEKFPIVVFVLSFAGLPVWVVRKIAEKVTFPKKEKPQPPKQDIAAAAAETPAAAETTRRAGVTQEAPPPAPPVSGTTADEIASELLARQQQTATAPDNVRPIRGAQ